MSLTPKKVYLRITLCIFLVLQLITSHAASSDTLSDGNALSFFTSQNILTDTICEGTCRIIGGEERCRSGTYTETVGDSTYNISLYVTPKIISYQDYTICEGDCFRTGDKEWCESGTYDYETFTQEGCSMVIVYNLIVKSHKETRIDRTIGYDECIDFGPNTLCQTGSYDLRYSTHYGCDSTVYINLTVEDLIVNAFSQTLCAGDCLSIADTTLCDNGLYEFLLENEQGKDSLIRVDLRIERELITQLEETACEGTPYTYNGTILTETGIYEYLFEAVNGCDSLVILDLSVGSVFTTSIERTLPEGECLAVGRNVICFAGQYEFVFQSMGGCDSLVMVDFTVVANPNGGGGTDGGGDPTVDPMPMDSIPVVPTDSTAMQMDSMGTSGSTDSCFARSINERLCYGEFYKVGDNTFWEGGVFNLSYNAPPGCNTEITLNLFIEPDRTTKLKQTICEGESFVVGDVAFRETGLYPVTLTAESGCDSLVELDLTVGLEKDTIINESICFGDFYLINNQIVTESGTYELMYQTVLGCDSLVVIELIVNGGGPTSDRVELCAGACLEVGKNRACTNGRYNFVYESMVGCDSVVTIDLIVPDTVRSEVADTFCLQDGYTLGFFQVNEEGRYRERLFNDRGCDSIVYYNLTTIDCEINSIQDADTVICGGNTGSFSFKLVKGLAPFMYKWNSEDRSISEQGMIDSLNQELLFTQLPGGIYTVAITDRRGTEAELEIEIVRPEALSATWAIPEFKGVNLACPNDADAFLEVFPAGGVPPYRYDWSNGKKTRRIENLPSGEYRLTITDHYNCPYVESRILNEPPSLELRVTNTNPQCEEIATGMIDITNMRGGTPPYEYSISGTNFSTLPTYQDLGAGSYTITARDANSCFTDTTLTIIQPKIIELSYDQDIQIELGDEIPLEIISSDPIKTITWSETEGLSCYDCLEPIAQPITPGQYSFTVTSEDNCETTGVINFKVAFERDVFVPNVFSPNSDGLNDRFTIFGGPEVSSVDYFRIYSRWGELLYETSELPINDTTKGWDGTFKGQNMTPGVYIWMAKVAFIDGKVIDYSGDVLLSE